MDPKATELDTKCSIRLCRNQAGTTLSPVTQDPVCQNHMQMHLTELDELKSAVTNRLAYFKRYARPLRLMQQRVFADFESLKDTFDDMREALDRCQKDLFDTVTKRHSMLLKYLEIVSDHELYESQLAEAIENNNMRDVYLLNKSMGTSLKSLVMDSTLVCIDQNTQEMKMAAFPDINSRVKELQTCLEMHLVKARNLVEFIDVADTEQTRVQLVKTKKVIDTVGRPVSMAMCTNTDGFVIDNAGIIQKVQALSDGYSEMPKTSIFVAIAESSPGIALLSPDAMLSAAVSCSWDADQPIVDIHCDSQRQLLYIAQKQAVTVTDLSGELQTKIAVSDLSNLALEFHCVTGNSDKLLALTKQSDGRAMVFGLSKDLKYEVQLTLPIPGTCSLSYANDMSISLNNNMLFVSDGGRVQTICTITGLQIISERMEGPEIFSDEGSVEDEDDIAVHLMFSGCQPGLCVSLLKTKLIAVSPRMLLTERSPEHIAYLALKEGTLFSKRLQISKKRDIGGVL